MTAVAVIDLSQLPAPQAFADVDYELLRQQMLDELHARMPDLQVHESDPAYKVLEVAAYYRMLDRQNANDQIRQLLMAYATGADLDQIGATYYATARLADETDAAYTRRLLLAYDAYSTAGSAQSYIYHALRADTDIFDATAINRHAGEVLVTVLAGQDMNANAAMLDAVRVALNDQRVRPLTDRVTVQAAQRLDFQVSATLTIRRGPADPPVTELAKQSVRDYINARYRLGEDIVRTAVIAALYVDGVERVTLDAPATDINCDATQAAHCTSIEVASDV